MTENKKPDSQKSPKEWPAVERQSKALEEIDTVLKSEKPAGEKLKKIVEDHTEACDEIKEKLEDHRADKVAEGLAEQGFPES
jgi:DNA-binding MurR/RpiR family transcriptional regulator